MYEISKETAQEIREMMKREKDVKAYRRLEAVALRGEGKSNGEIAELTGFHPDWVGKLVKEYIQFGATYLIEDDRKGGNNRNASHEEEEKFLEQFKKAAQNGQIITVADIATAYDKEFGKEHKSKSTVYYLLHKFEWRKVMPRPEHPNKASDEVIEASKKLTKPSRARWKILQQEMSG